MHKVSIVLNTARSSDLAVFFSFSSLHSLDYGQVCLGPDYEGFVGYFKTMQVLLDSFKSSNK